jgi:hypothetical protein
MTILSPLATGNGAHVPHRLLKAHIPKDRTRSCDPRLTFSPVVLPLAVNLNRSRVIIYSGVDTNRSTPTELRKLTENNIKGFFSGNLTRRYVSNLPANVMARFFSLACLTRSMLIAGD